MKSTGNGETDSVGECTVSDLSLDQSVVYHVSHEGQQDLFVYQLL